MPTRKLHSKDVADFQRISSFVESCVNAPLGKTEAFYKTLGGMLLDSATDLELDEDISNLIAFAKCLAIEIVARTERTRSVNEWEHNYFDVKAHGKNSPRSDIRNSEKQKIAMLGTFSFHLAKSAKFKALSSQFLAHEQEHNLWTEADYIQKE